LAAFVAAAFAAAAFAAVVFAVVDRAADFAAAALVAAALAAADFAAAVFAAALLAVVLAGVVLAAVVLAAVVFAAVLFAAGLAVDLAVDADFGAVDRAAEFFAAAVRAAAADRGAADDALVFAPEFSARARFRGSTTTSVAGAAFSAAALAAVAVPEAARLAPEACFAVGFRAAAVFFAVAGFAAVRGAVFFAADPPVVVSSGVAAPELCFLAGARFPDVLFFAVSVSSTWAVRSSGEAVTVLRYQRVASSQGPTRQSAIRERRSSDAQGGCPACASGVYSVTK
jgi:hypothetical protein